MAGPVKRPAGRIAPGTLKNMREQKVKRPLADILDKYKNNKGPSEFQRIHNELNIRRKPILTQEKINRIKEIISDAKKEASKISTNEMFNSGFVVGKLMEKGITQETLRDAGFSFRDIKAIFGKYFDKSLFYKKLK